MFPKRTVATVTGIGGMAGALGGILIAWAAGLVLKHYTALGNIKIGYSILFIVCGLAYISAWMVINILAPKLKRVDL
jgi:ACS family hexuronate transporter-like MFS transporter